ncbi:MAG: DUF983 domain-containing protein [Anaerolineae bacterium]
MKIGYALHKLWLGLRLRCPNCEQGRMFSGLFQIEPVCPHCNARFERQSGESIGGTLINLCTAEVLTMGGYLLTQFLFSPSLVFQLTFWIAFNLIFIVLFYRHARALWVSVSYLSGDVYPDGQPPVSQGQSK